MSKPFSSFYNYSQPHPPPPPFRETFFLRGGLIPPPTISSSGLYKTSSKSPHPLDTTPPNLLLTRTLNPIFKLSKWIGIFPLEIDQDGWASFGVKKFPSLLYLVWLLIFIGLSAYYSPLYLQLMSADRNQASNKVFPRPASIHTIAKYLFVSGQFLAAAATFLVVPRLARRTASHYNRLNAIITTLGERGQDSGINVNFRRKYLTSRIAVGIWFLVVICSLYLWWNSFHTYFRSQYGQESGWKYYGVVGGALSLAIVIAGHVMPSFVFLGLAGVIRATYQTIHKQKLPNKVRAVGHPGHGHYAHPVGAGKVTHGDLNQLSLTLDLFARLNGQMNRLSEIFGRYLIIEMSAFFTAILTNAFTLLTGFESGRVKWDTTFISIFINILWFAIICEAGEAVGREQQRCLKVLKTWIVETGIGGGGVGMEGSWLITTLLDDEVRGVTAAGYFRIKRSLSTQVVGAIMMYLIVMLQFKETG